MFKYWYLKLLALVLAILLWFVAWGLASSAKDIKGVPIKVKNLRPNLAYASDVYEVDLKVVAKKDKLNDLEAEDFEATLDMMYWEKGTYNQKIEISAKGGSASGGKSLEGVEVISITPDNLVVRIEDKTEKEVRIEGVFEGIPAKDYLVGSSKIEPEKVKAIGPKSEIDSLNKATIRIKLNGEKDSFVRDIEIEAIDSQGRKIRSISFEPKLAKVNVYIFSGSNNKAVGIKPKISGIPLAGFWVSDVTTDPATIIINSDTLKLSSIDSVETSLYDITGLKENKEDTVALVFPSGVASVENIKEVKIRIELSSIEMTREMYGSVVFKNTPAGHRVTRTNPDTIRVVVSGPLSLTRTLTSSNVVIE
ncbi:MAG: CdaR family protein, partial [Candidatus Berkelbacteria bacterium]|nr:CdaR family protein [Candidatus Berkelbacteria bacterium]